MRLIPVFAIALYGSCAFAYQEGTYSCKNAKGLPENIYKIKDVSVGPEGTSLPYIEATRFFRQIPTDPTSPVLEAHLKGMASVSQLGETSTLMLAALQLEFQGEILFGCARK